MYKDIKTFEDAFSIYEKTNQVSLNLRFILFSEFEGEELVIQANAKLRIIAKAIQGDWIADYSNSDQHKWYPYFEYKKSAGGFVFYYADGYFTSSSLGGGVRLSFETRDQANHFGTQFIALINITLLG
jgi:hypothetical protein